MTFNKKENCLLFNNRNNEINKQKTTIYGLTYLIH